jgi:hypothetical protein
VIALTIGAVHENTRNHRLQNHGSAVQVTVTSCLGKATGTGITVNGFTCRGNYVLNGHQYNEVITGNTQLFAVGATIKGVADPTSPSTLSTASALTRTEASWRPFVRPVIPAIALLLLVVFAFWRARRNAHDDGYAGE